MRSIGLIATGVALGWIMVVSALLFMYRLVYLRQKLRSFAEGSLRHYGQSGQGFAAAMDWFWEGEWANDPIARLVKRQFAYTPWGKLAEKQRVPQATKEES